MRLRNEAGGLIPPVSLWETLERLRFTLDWSEAELADRLELDEKNFQRLQSRRKEPTIHSILALGEALELSMERLLSGEIDYPALARRQAGDTAALPDRYLRAAYSRMRTPMYFLDYLERFYGWRKRAVMLRHLQVSEAAFVDPNAPLSIAFAFDFCDTLHRKGFSMEDFHAMGAYMVVPNRRSELAGALKRLGTPRAVYENMPAITRNHVERSYLYSLERLRGECAVIRSVPNPEVMEQLRLKTPGSPANCAQRAGTMSSLVGHLDLPFAKVREIACIHHGDPACLFEIDFSPAQAHRTVAP